MTDDPEELEGYRRVYEYLNHPPETKRDLYRFLNALTGIKIPFTKVCPYHDTPFDFIWDTFKIDLDEFKKESNRNIVCIGPRAGLKTLSQAHLVIAELLLKPNCGTILMAAAMGQNVRSYEYISKYIKHPVIVDSGLIRKIIRTKLELSNDSVLDLTCATFSGTNSAHVPKLRIDEVELIDNPAILEEAKMIPASRGKLTAQTTYISTRKFVDGNMEDFVKRGRVKGKGKSAYKVMTWCIKEVSEPCPEERRGTQPKLYEMEDVENPGESVVFTAYEGCKECPLISVCRGDLAKSRGFIPIEDTINEFHTLDMSSFLAQKLCVTPKRSDMFFADFSQKLQVGEFPYRPDLPMDMAFDFTNGGDAPTAVLFIQEDPNGDITFFAGLSFVRKPTETVARELKQFAVDHGIRAVRMQVGDSAQMLTIRDLNNMDPGFFKIIPTKKILRKEGWPLCRRSCMDTSGRRRLRINEQYCKGVIKEILNARRSKSDPDDVAANCESHFLDGWRYWEVKTHGGQGMPNVRILDYTPEVKNTSGQIIVPPANSDDNRPFIDRVWDMDRDAD